MWILIALACAVETPPPPAAHEHGDHATMHHRFDDAAKWSAVFDDPKRDDWQHPDAVVAALDLREGMVVADIGAGTGYFNPHLARGVGQSGKVIAVDIEPTLIAHLTERAVKESTPQVEARLGRPEDPSLGPAEVDRILVVDTYHHIDDRRAYFSKLGGALRPSGLLIVIDFKPGEIPVGPPEGLRIPEAQVIEELGAAGWSSRSRFDLPYQFGLVFER